MAYRMRMYRVNGVTEARYATKEDTELVPEEWVVRDQKDKKGPDTQVTDFEYVWLEKTSHAAAVIKEYDERHNGGGAK